MSAKTRPRDQDDAPRAPDNLLLVDVSDPRDLSRLLMRNFTPGDWVHLRVAKWEDNGSATTVDLTASISQATGTCVRNTPRVQGRVGGSGTPNRTRKRRYRLVHTCRCMWCGQRISWGRERHMWIPINPDDTAHECRSGRGAARPRIGRIRPMAFVLVDKL